MATTRIPSVEGGIQPTLLTTKGDLISATAASTVARLGVGSDAQILVADSSTATGLKWAAPAGGGKVLQVVSATYSSYTTTTSTTYGDSGLTATITPSSATSKVLAFATVSSVYKNTGNLSNAARLQLVRGSTSISLAGDRIGFTNVSGNNNIGTVSMNYLDSPATTSATTYKVQIASGVSGQLMAINDYETTQPMSTIILMEIGA